DPAARADRALPGAGSGYLRAQFRHQRAVRRRRQGARALDGLVRPAPEAGQGVGRRGPQWRTLARSAQGHRHLRHRGAGRGQSRPARGDAGTGLRPGRPGARGRTVVAVRQPPGRMPPRRSTRPGQADPPEEQPMKPTDSSPPSVAVVIPSYKVTRHILQVIASIGDDVDHIIVVDDACPEGSGKLVESGCSDPRVCVVYHAQNQGVGGAVLTGYQRALELGADIIVKIDGDGQMDPALLPNFVAPIAALEADYTKGNRFYDLRNIGQMPAIRLFGNAALSFMAKVSTGYWDLFDPTNGYTAISARVAALLPFERISRRYFFETDLLFRLGTFRAVVVDIPMDARYGDEVSNLRIGKVLTEFLLKPGRNFFKRVFYSYFLRDMSLASLELLAGCALVLFGAVFGLYHWGLSVSTGAPASTGTVMLAALPLLVGLQLLLAFLAYDIASVPRKVL